MKTLIILLVALVFATSVIAYWSDNLGKKLGKKRISLLGLRPRQTATAITILSSQVIMLLTIAAVLWISNDVRQALTSYDQLKSESRQLRLQAEHDRGEVESARSRLSSTTAQLTATGKQLTGTNRALQAKAGELKERDVQLAARGRELKGTAARLFATNARLLTTNGRLQAATMRVVNVQQDYRVQQELYRTATRQYKQVSRNLETARRHLDQANANLKLTQSNLKATLAKNRDLLADYKRVTDTVTQRQVEVHNLELRRDELEVMVNNLQEIPVTSSIYQVFAARTLPAHVSSDNARAALLGLIHEAGDVVRQQLNGGTLTLSPLPVMVGESVVKLNETEIIQRLTEYLPTFSVPVSVQVVAARNYVAGEKNIEARIFTVPEKIIFPSGQVITSVDVNGGDTDVRIFHELWKLVEKGQQIALDRGVTPPITRQNLHFYAPDTNERMFEALRRVQELRGPARVRLVAATPVSSIEPVQVRFDVSVSPPAGSNAQSG